VVEPILVPELPEALDGQRVDRVVALVAGVSRTMASGLIAAGQVTVDGAAVTRPSTRLTVGSRLTVELNEPAGGLVPFPGMNLHLVHVDEAVVVVDKAAGLVVHPGSGTQGDTMVHGLLALFPELIEVGPDDRPGIVHRLDKGTSGLLMVARTIEARVSLTEQLKARTVDREYRTLVWGIVEAERGVIDAPLGRSGGNALRQAVVASGRPARTNYEVLGRYETLVAGEGRSLTAKPVTLLRCQLETGRTHQIRAHLEAIGHPVVGDVAYRGSARRTGLGLPSGRPFLHAAVLGFDHPVSGERLRFASALPGDLEAVLATLTPESRDGG
jgi:23S rRNA pseudouridine1911/1915/1917 synthase